MSLQKKLKDILEISQGTNISSPGSVAELLNQITRLSRINAVEKSANMSAISEYAPKIIYNLSNGVNQTSVKSGDIDVIAQLARSIKLFGQFLPPGAVDQQYLTALTDARRVLQGQGRSLINQKAAKMQQKTIVSDIISKQMLQSPQITSLQASGLTLPPQSGSRGIQRQVDDIQNIITGIPSTAMIGTRSLPPTMTVLSNYCKILGYAPVGTITGMKSSSYVGIDVSYDDDVQVNRPFPYSQKNFVAQTASIQQSFKQYAGKTINAWNNYVAAQEQFVQFTNKINSRQKRQEYVKGQIQGMNTNTFSAQVLSTLLYYYVAIPFRYMIQKTKKTINTIDESERSKLFSLHWFFKNYQISPGMSYNPLSISYENIKTLIGLLYNFKKFAKPGSPTQQQLKSANLNTDYKIGIIFEAVTTFLKDKAILPIGKNKLSDVMTYVTTKQMQSSVYLKSMNIDAATTTKIRQKKAISPLRQFKVTVPNIYANSEVLMLINDALTDKNSTDPLQDGLFKLTWGGDSFPAYDYIWGKKLM